MQLLRADRWPTFCSERPQKLLNSTTGIVVIFYKLKQRWKSDNDAVHI